MFVCFVSVFCAQDSTVNTASEIASCSDAVAAMTVQASTSTSSDITVPPTSTTDSDIHLIVDKQAPTDGSIHIVVDDKTSSSRVVRTMVSFTLLLGRMCKCFALINRMCAV